MADYLALATRRIQFLSNFERLIQIDIEEL